MDSSSRLPRPSGIPRASGIPRPSGIPKPSTLPVPQRPGRASVSPAPSERLRPSSSLRAAPSPRASSTPRPPVGTGIPARPAARKDDDVFKKPIARPASRQARSRIQRPAVSAINTTNVEQEDDVLGDLDGFRTSSRLSHRDGHSGEFDSGLDEGQPRERPGARQEGGSTKREPSLTDRTLESLGRIMAEPTSPSSRSTSWYPNPTSPGMGPPGRPASAMSSRASRPASRTAGAFRSSSQRPITPTLRPPSSMSRASSTTRSSQNQRSASAAPRSPAASTDSQPMSPAAFEQDSESEANLMSPIGLKSPDSLKSPQLVGSTDVASPSARVSKTPFGFSKATVRKLPRTRPPAAANPDDNLLSPIEAPESETERTLPSRPTTSAKKAPAKVEASDPSSKVKSSSSALREQIAKAKSARKTAPTKPAMPVTNDAPVGGGDIDAFEDPFNQMPKGGAAVIKKRVDTARSDGRLNIANMGLSEIPKEVMTMYEYNPDAGIEWSASVDLVRFNAADNDIERLPEDLFPDIDPAEAAEDMDAVGPQFGGLEMLDLHGNIMTELPVGLRRLEGLTILNLSRNRLHNDAFEVISQIGSLRELRIAENDLEGDLPQSIGSLNNLEVLELQGNRIARLPDALRELVNLRVLNVNTNGMSSLPMDVLAALPLAELFASKNALRGTFFPETVTEMSRLQTLDLSGNALTSLGSSDLSMPALKSLNLSINRIETLPDLTRWTSLLTLLVEENKLSEFPAGFTSLRALRQANFNGNNISKLEPEIAQMDSLDMLTLAANPLRERKFLTMNAEDLKSELKRRHNTTAAGVDGSNEAGDGVEDVANGIIPANSMWAMKPGGLLDLSSKSLAVLHENEFSPVASACRQLVLHHNFYTHIPDSISLATNITLLDLSNNRLTTTFTDAVSLPALRDLRLAANKLPSLDFLAAHLAAPRLHALDVSANHITGALPLLRARFPHLTTLLASDNGIDEISVTALAGLQVVGLANNSIGRIPPEVGLLWDEGLKSLEIEGNTFRVPTYATLKRGTEAVMAWLRDKIPAAPPPPPPKEVEEGGAGSWEDETF
ncbi:conserved leucine-rich repeat protein [Diplodia corticola]|uniref:Conserved leucine-rich repeat protein n=1 Tax=Diplodia corticola TaxID=236234 RepID=A0A1J9SHP1_9PEZI|nr:conserved leucine-rich repeat protein [Diplodia corticola]OJD39895.1 conserved leucine-rich repeat protein [Diplodia corticola]